MHTENWKEFSVVAAYTRQAKGRLSLCVDIGCADSSGHSSAPLQDPAAFLALMLCEHLQGQISTTENDYVLFYSVRKQLFVGVEFRIMLHLANICYLDLTSQDDSLPTASIPGTFDNFVILFTLHHSPSPLSSLFLVFLIYSKLCWWCNSTPLPLFSSSSSSSLTAVTQDCENTSPVTTVLSLVLQPLIWSHRRICHDESQKEQAELFFVLYFTSSLLPLLRFSVILCL